MVNSSCILFFLVLVAIHGSIQKSNSASPTYRAAVVELTSVFHENDSTKTLNDNAEKFVSYIERAAEKPITINSLVPQARSVPLLSVSAAIGVEGVDIIVFPELGITSLTLVDRKDFVSRATILPDPSQNYMPCITSNLPIVEAVKTIACASERNGIYVVVNLLEKEVCSGNDCPGDGIFLYITSVAFDREGKIVSRYRKGHLLAEYGIFDAMETPEISTFDTDFGVTFGNVIGFDVMFEEPWVTLTRKVNVTDIIFSAKLFAEMPFLTTDQIEAGIAYIADVNMLASGHNKIEWGISGSGIYAGRQGAIASILPLHEHEGMLIADVKKKKKKTVVSSMFNNNRRNQSRLANGDYEHFMRDHLNQGPNSHSFYWRYEQLDEFKTKLITKNGLTLEKLNHFGIKCRFQVNVSNLIPPVTYRMLAFDGVRTLSNTTVLGTRTCAVVQCANDTIESCGHVHNSSATFNYMAITAMYVDNTRIMMIPSTLGTDMLPLKNWTYKEFKHEADISKSLSLTAPTQNLVTFGIWGRNFEKDRLSLIRRPESITGSASRIISQILSLPLLWILLKNVSSLL